MFKSVNAKIKEEEKQAAQPKIKVKKARFNNDTSMIDFEQPFFGITKGRNDALNYGRQRLHQTI